MSDIAYGPPTALLHADTGSYGMAREAWLRVPVYASGILKFPLADKDFKGVYGNIGNASEYKEIVSAVKKAQEVLAVYGEPVTLTKKIAQDGDYLMKATPPSGFYAQGLWAAYKVQHAASLFASRAQSLRSELEKYPLEIEKNATFVRNVFTGERGLSSLCSEQKDHFAVLVDTSGKTVKDFQAVQQPLTDRMGKSSKTYADAKKVCKDYESQISTFDRTAGEAWTEWLEFRGAQPTQTWDVCVVNYGVPVGVSDVKGQVPQAKAVAARKAYTVLQGALNTAKDEVVFKACLVADLGGFDLQLGVLPAALTSLWRCAKDMADAWDKVSADLTRACALTDNDLGNLEHLNDAIGFDKGAWAWESLGTSAEMFTRDALVAPVFAPWGYPLETS